MLVRSCKECVKHNRRSRPRDGKPAAALGALAWEGGGASAESWLPHGEKPTISPHALASGAILHRFLALLQACALVSCASCVQSIHSPVLCPMDKRRRGPLGRIRLHCLHALVPHKTMYQDLQAKPPPQLYRACTFLQILPPAPLPFG